MDLRTRPRWKQCGPSESQPGESDPVDPVDPTRMDPKIIMPRHVQMFEKQQQVRNTAKVNKQFKDN